MTLFLHSEDPMKIIESDRQQTVRDLLETEGGEGALWLENAHDPLPARTKLADIPSNAHLSRSRCRRIAATAKFNGEGKEKSFAPGATVATVFEWATGNHGYDLPASQRPKHTLALCGTQTQPDKSAHLSELAGDDCTVCFDLAPKVRFEG